jgi:hypothetical protein
VNFQAADGTWTPIDTTPGKGGDERGNERSGRDQVDFAGREGDGRRAEIAIDD